MTSSCSCSSSIKGYTVDQSWAREHVRYAAIGWRPTFQNKSMLMVLGCVLACVWAAGLDSLLHPLLGVHRGGLVLAQHHPVLVGVLRHRLPPVVHRLHLRVAAKDVRHAFLPGWQRDTFKESIHTNYKRIHSLFSLILIVRSVPADSLGFISLLKCYSVYYHVWKRKSYSHIVEAGSSWFLEFFS